MVEGAMEPGRQFVIPEGSQRIILRTPVKGSQLKKSFKYIYIDKIYGE